MKEIFNLALNDKITKYGLILSGIFLLLNIVSIGIFYFSLPPLVPVFNQMPWGEKRLGIKLTIALPAILATSFLFLNFFTSANLYGKTPLLSRILSITAFLVSLLSFIFVARTVYLLI